MTIIKEIHDVMLTLSDNAMDLNNAINNNQPAIAIIDEDNELPFTRFAVTRDFFDDDSAHQAEFCERVVRRFLKQSLIIDSGTSVYIRELSLDDIDLIEKIYSEAKGLIEPFYDTKEELEEYLKQYIFNVYDFSDYGMWGIVKIGESNDIIGIVGITQREDIKELSYALCKEHEGFGYAYEACRLALKKIAPEPVVVNINSENHRSIALADRLSEAHKIDIRIIS